MESFVAWNGLSYAGNPPDGWYLAQDGRWWPESNTPEPSQPVSAVPSRWVVTEGSLDGYLVMEADGLRCVFQQGGLEDHRLITFDSILRASRTKNTFGSDGVRIQTNSQTFEWGLNHRRDELVRLVNQRIGHPHDLPGDVGP